MAAIQHLASATFDPVQRMPMTETEETVEIMEMEEIEETEDMVELDELVDVEVTVSAVISPMIFPPWVA